MLGWELPPHNSGGLGVACYHLSKALALNGVSIDFVVPYTEKHESIDFMEVLNATPLSPLHKFGMGAYHSQFELEESTTANEETAQTGLRTIRDVQKKYVHYVETHLATTANYDAIHAHDWLTLEAGVRAKELTGKPLIAHVHATEFDRAGGQAGNPLVHEIEYQGLLAADKIVAVSGLTKRIIVEKYGIPAEKIDVSYNAIDTSSFDETYQYDTQTYQYLEGLKKEGYTVVSAVTRLTVQKGLTHLVTAFAKAADKCDRLALLLAGDGEQRDELIRLAADLGISDKVFFTGFVRGKKWRDAYSVSDVFALSSISEPFGLTALEAAHHDTALVVTKQSGVGEVLHSVLRYDFWDTDRLADQLVGIATSPALKQSLRDNVKHEYARLSWNDAAAQCMAIYKNKKPVEIYA